MKSYNHILGAVASEVWALQPEKLRAMIGFLQMKATGRESEMDVLARVKASAAEARVRAQSVSSSSGGAVAVLPLFGLIMQRANMLNNISGPSGTSVEMFTKGFRAALNDPNVSAIVIDIDSPGGCVSGVPELASEILAARKASGKKIIAVSDSLCASAAYWIASACSEVVVSPSSLTGSIGVYSTHEDISKAMEAEGVAITLISYGAHKVDGNPYAPLTDDARADVQQTVDYYGVMFEKAVAQGRKMKVADVQSKLGQGKVFNAQKAVSSGMADSIGTLDDVLARFGAARQPSGQASGRSFGSATVPAISAAGPASTDGECTCPCDSCEGGDCSGCEMEDCGFAGCACDGAKNKVEKAKALAAHAHRERVIRIAQMQ